MTPARAPAPANASRSPHPPPRSRPLRPPPPPGRILNVSVTAADTREPPRLLNYLTGAGARFSAEPACACMHPWALTSVSERPTGGGGGGGGSCTPRPRAPHPHPRPRPPTHLTCRPPARPPPHTHTPQPPTCWCGLRWPAPLPFPSSTPRSSCWPGTRGATSWGLLRRWAGGVWEGCGCVCGVGLRGGFAAQLGWGCRGPAPPARPRSPPTHPPPRAHARPTRHTYTHPHAPTHTCSQAAGEMQRRWRDGSLEEDLPMRGLRWVGVGGRGGGGVREGG